MKEHKSMNHIKHEETEIDLSQLLSHLNQDGYLPDPEMLNFYKMREHRRLWIDVNVDYSMIEFVRMIILWNMEDKGKSEEEREPIWIMLENYGGDSDMMWMMLDAMNTSVTPIYTVNLGIAGSAASLIFMSGKKRFMMPNASVVIHDGSAQIGGDAVKVLDASDSYRKELKKMREYILDKTNIPASTLNRKRNNDWTIDADYCLEHGVCDKVVDSLDCII